MIDPAQIESAMQRVNDQTSFVQELLIDTLGWPIDEAAKEIGDIAYEWTEDELRAAGLNEKIVGGKAYQIILPGNPWGIFVMEFANPDVFTTGRGMTGVLRRVLHGLVTKGRGGQSSNLPRFTQDNLLFICNHDYERYRFAHFKPAPDGTGTPPMASFGWGPDDLDAVRTICEFNLRALEWPDATPSTEAEWLNAWQPAFDIEKVTKRFYQDYAEVFHRVEDIIKKTKALKGDDLRMFTQSLFNRLMFLRFIERKGWLKFPGQTGSRYLATLASAGGIGIRSLYASRLSPLFFEGLAEEGKQKSQAYGSVPLLNGGLFEKSKLDDMVKDIPDEAFTPIFGQGGLFYRYNFTVEESTPLDIEVAVDPEMLGKVFEELVTGRHESGSYYTPRPVVAFMCREALKGHLADRTKAPQSAIAKLIDDHIVEGLTEAHAKAIIEALDNLKAVDPACGSGAYLLGLLHELIAIRRALQSEKLAADPGFLYDLKLHIISHNLYGVDIDPFATEIAKLRLWLSLAVEANQPVPLPNLDFKIETGDSLLGPNPQDLPGLFLDQVKQQADKLVALKDAHLLARGREKVKTLKAVLNEETTIAKALQVDPNRSVIDWRIQFAEIFGKRKGFDILLANPPYVDSEQMVKTSAVYRGRLVSNFIVTRGNWDLYIPFWQRSADLLAPDGRATLITPNKWLSAPYGRALRNYIKGLVTWIADYTRFRAFKNVGVSSIVTSINKRGSDSIQVFHFTEGHALINSITAPAAFAASAGNWGMLLSENLEIVEKLASCNQLSEFCDAEEPFTVSEAYELSELIANESDPPANSFRFMNTGTVDPYVSLWGEKNTTYLKQKYLHPVVNRSAFKKQFPRRFLQAESPKIIISGMRHFEAYLDSRGDWIAGKSTVILRAFRNGLSYYAALGILNSSISRFYLKECYGSLGMDGGINFSPSNVGELPVPQLENPMNAGIESLVDKILSLGISEHERRLALMDDIDALLFQAFGLNEEEIAAITKQVHAMGKRHKRRT